MVTAVLAQTEEVVKDGAIPPVAFGILAFTVLMTLLFVAFAFRSVGTRH